MGLVGRQDVRHEVRRDGDWSLAIRFDANRGREGIGDQATDRISCLAGRVGFFRAVSGDRSVEGINVGVGANLKSHGGHLSLLGLCGCGCQAALRTLAGSLAQSGKPSFSVMRCIMVSSSGPLLRPEVWERKRLSQMMMSPI